MSTGAPALLDADALRRRTQATIFEPPHPEPLVVLGSATGEASLDVAALHRDGIGLRRRRGGGGAVLLHPDDAWIELWWPASGGPPRDTRVTAGLVGARWRDALLRAGVTTHLHEGSLERARDGATACFAALGPGELTVGARKLLGLSQWRVREGVLVSCVLAQRAPSDLAAYLTDDGARTAIASVATSLEELRATSTATACAQVARRELRALIGAGEDLADAFW